MTHCIQLLSLSCAIACPHLYFYHHFLTSALSRDVARFSDQLSRRISARAGELQTYVMNNADGDEVAGRRPESRRRAEGRSSGCSLFVPTSMTPGGCISEVDAALVGEIGQGGGGGHTRLGRKSPPRGPSTTNGRCTSLLHAASLAKHIASPKLARMST